MFGKSQKQKTTNTDVYYQDENGNVVSFKARTEAGKAAKATSDKRRKLG
jgi:hypothetical protein